MPQLAIETYFSQYFWLFVIFFLFNHFILNSYIPAIATLLKTRKIASAGGDNDSLTKDSWAINIKLPELNISSIKLNNFTDTRINWINKTENK